MRISFVITSLIALLYVMSGRAHSQPETFTVTEDITLVKLADGVYLHVSEEDFGRFGRVSSNGLVVIGDGEAVMVDTPANDVQTEALTRYIEEYFGAEVSLLIPTHWHDDCIGGINFLHSYGAESLAFEMTRQICQKEGITMPKTGFDGSLVLERAGKTLCLFYPGGGHSLDNIIVWLPDEKILFGGCLVKELISTNLGNTADADIEAWPHTIRKVIEMFPNAGLIIPGHGKTGGMELLEHTLGLLE